MPEPGSVVVIGGTSGLGLEVARHYAKQGREVVLSGRDQGRAEAAAADVGGRARGVALDLAEPGQLADRLAGVEGVGHLVLAAIERDENTVRDFDLEGATRLATLKLVGYAETVHQLAPRMDPGGSVVLFGGRAKDRPYPGSTMVSTVNGGVIGLVHSLAVELAPIRCNAIHPGIVGDSPYWSAKGEPALEPVRNRTPTRRLVTMEDIVGAVVFLLENRSVNGENLHVDGGWLLL
ncbi:MAG TPA: SDR family oxidoreductase [Actinomycetota bacterium]|jgi:NAD(P)-dependent dehydrogenase (short-subunit alcohol dehydrogenase family)|nr:SDR family oxidoreductase [Actinomycetota bacterium]